METKSKVKKEPRHFSDKDSAELYYNEYAMCQMTGKTLWLLDKGIVNWDSIQIDHILPWSKGGKSELSNAALLCGNANYNAGDTKQKVYNFNQGFPSGYYFYINDRIFDGHKKQLLKFVRLLPSDFYFNRALEAFLFGIDFRRNPTRVSGKTLTRNDSYHAKTVVSWIQKWNKAKEPYWTSFEERELLEPNLEADQQIMLKVRDVKTVDDVMKLYDELEPFYLHLFKCKDAFYKGLNRIFYNFVNCAHFNFDGELSDYVQNAFSSLFDLLKDEKTLLRYKNDVLDTIEFLKVYCAKIYEYRFDHSEDDEIKMKFFVATYKSVLNRKKEADDVYAQTTAEILENDFPKKLIDLNVCYAFDIKSENGKCEFVSEEADQENFFNNVNSQAAYNVIFLVNDDEFAEQHKTLIKNCISAYLDTEVKELEPENLHRTH